MPWIKTINTTVTARATADDIDLHFYKADDNAPEAPNAIHCRISVEGDNPPADISLHRVGRTDAEYLAVTGLTKAEFATMAALLLKLRNKGLELKNYVFSP